VAAVLLDGEVPAGELVGEVAAEVESSAPDDERHTDQSEPGKVAQRVHVSSITSRTGFY
jgi:hypothetical protein